MKKGDGMREWLQRSGHRSTSHAPRQDGALVNENFENAHAGPDARAHANSYDFAGPSGASRLEALSRSLLQAIDTRPTYGVASTARSTSASPWKPQSSTAHRRRKRDFHARTCFIFIDDGSPL